MTENQRSLFGGNVEPLPVAAKKPGKIIAVVAAVVAAKSADPLASGGVSPIVMVIDGHVTCEGCGATLIDLIDIRGDRWLVGCGWLCMTTWTIDPIPGLLDESQPEESEFRVRGGQFAGLTFQEIWDSGGEWYLDFLVKKSKRNFLATAAAQWLSTRLTRKEGRIS